VESIERDRQAFGIALLGNRLAGCPLFLFVNDQVSLRQAEAKCEGRQSTGAKMPMIHSATVGGAPLRKQRHGL
jgi:hypothetical protein